jgi:hypothetical protein
VIEEVEIDTVEFARDVEAIRTAAHGETGVGEHLASEDPKQPMLVDRRQVSAYRTGEKQAEKGRVSLGH